MQRLKIAICDDEKTNIYDSFHDNEGLKETFISQNFPEYDRLIESKLYGSKEEVKEAIDRGEFNYEIVITDINFGGETIPNDKMYEGLEILKIIKRYTPNTDIILVTAYSGQYSFDDIVKAHRNRMMDWLKKGKTAELVSYCLTCGQQRRRVGEGICRKCGDPLEKFWYELKKILNLTFKKWDRVKEMEEKLSQIKKALSPPELYEVTIMQKDFSEGPILATVSKKENPGTKITLELNPRIQGLVFLVLAEEAGRKFLDPRIIANRVNKLRELEEPIILNEEEHLKFIKAGSSPPCNLDSQRARNCETYCDALKLPEVCPFDYLLYLRYNLRRFTAENVRTHIKEIRNMIFSKVQEQAGDKKLTRCIYSGLDIFCSLLDPIRVVCKICRNDFIIHTPRGYGLAAKVRHNEE